MLSYLVGACLGFNETKQLTGIIPCFRKLCLPNLYLSILGGLALAFLHLGANLLNDFFDHYYGADAVNNQPTTFSGGSRFIQNGEILPKNVFYLALSFLCLGSFIGLYINYLKLDNVILYLGIFGILAGFIYSFKASYIGLGEPIIGLAFGPGAVLGAYYIIAENLSLKPIFVSLPIGLLVVLILWINELLDFSADKKSDKFTLVVKLGEKKARKYFVLLGISVYILLMLNIILGTLPIKSLLGILAILPAFISWNIVSHQYYDRQKLITASALTIFTHILFCIFVSLGFIF